MRVALVGLVWAAAAAASQAPLYFEPNRGQQAPSVRYLAPVRNAVVYLTDSGIAFNGTVTLMFEGGTPSSSWTPASTASGTTTYLTGRHPSPALREIPHFPRIQRKGIYPGIDLILYGSEGRLEYDFVVAPGADPRRIAMRFQGARELRIGANGDLIVSTDSGELVQRKPYLYQDRAVEGRYRIAGPDRVIFEVGAFDPARVLTIDPVLESLTLLGGSSDDRVAFADPRIAIVGTTRSADLPGAGVAQHRGADIFAYLPDSQSTYIIGGSGDDIVTCVSTSRTFGPGAPLIIGGYTNSRDFPVTGTSGYGYSSTPQTQYGGGDWDGFVIFAGVPAFNTYTISYLGGSGDDRVLAVDTGTGTFGVVGVAGSTTSPDFPLMGAWQRTPAGGIDGFAALLNYNGMLVSSYLGGSDDDRALAITVTSDTEFFVAGETRSAAWPVGAAAWNGSRNGPSDGFLLRFARDTNAGAFTYSAAAMYGGSGEDSISQLAPMPNGMLAAAGTTRSPDFSAAGNPAAGSLQGDSDIFLVKTSRDLQSVSLASLIGGSGAEQPLSLAVSQFNELLLAGWTSSADFPQTRAVQAQYGGGASDGFLYYVDSAGQPVLSTWLGGSGADQITWAGFDDGQHIFLGGVSDSADMPQPTAAPGINAGGADGFFGAITIPIIRADGVTAGKNLAAKGYARLGDPANYIGVPLTISSADPASVLLASRADEAGSPSVTIAVRATTPDIPGRGFLVYCLTDNAAVPLTLSAPGYPSQTITARCVPSGIYTGGPEIAVHSDGSGVASGSLNVYTAAFDPGTGALLQVQNPRGGIGPVRVDAASSDPSLLAVDQGSVTIDGFSSLVTNQSDNLVPLIRFKTTAIGSADLILTNTSGFPFLPTDRVRVRSVGPVIAVYVPAMGKDLVDLVSVSFTPTPRSPAPITLTSSDASRLRFTPTPLQSGTATAFLQCAASVSCTTYIELLDGGPVSITASAPGSDPVTIPVRVNDVTAGLLESNSRQLLTSRNLLSGSTLSAYVAIGANLPGNTAVLGQAPKLRAGAAPLTFTLTNSDPTVASTTSTQFRVSAGQDLQLGPVAISPKSDGNTSLSLAFTGGGVDRIVPVALTVSGYQWKLGNFTLGNNLQIPVYIPNPLPYSEPLPPITIASADPSRLLISAGAPQAGSGSVTVQPGNYGIFLQALSGSGDVEITASTPGGATAKGLVHLVPSGVGWTARFGTVTLNRAAPATVTVFALDPVNLAPIATQSPRAGLDGGVTVHSSDSSVAALTPSPLSFTAFGERATPDGGNVTISPIAPGETLFDLDQPPGFIQPAGYRPLRVKVPKPSVTLPALTLGRNMQLSFGAAFSGRTPDPAALQPLTFKSADPAKLVFSVAAGDPGAATATVRYPFSGYDPSYSGVYAPVWAQALDGPADVGITASLDGYDDASAVVQIVPTILSFAQQIGTNGMQTNTQADPLPVTLYASTASSYPQYSTSGMVLRAGLESFPVTINSSNPGVAAVVKAPNLNALTASSTFTVRAVAPGDSLLTLTPPPGFVKPPTGAGDSLKISVAAPSFTLPDVTVGRDLQLQSYLSITNGSNVLPADTDVTLTSSDPSRLILSSAADLPGAPSLKLHLPGSRSIGAAVYLQALDDHGTVSVQISAPGYAASTATITLTRTAIVTDSSDLRISAGNPTAFQLRGVPMPGSQQPSFYGGGGYSFRAGLPGFSIGLAARDPGIVSISPARVDMSGGTGTVNVSVSGIAAGTTSIAFDVPAAYAAPGVVTVTVQGGQLSWPGSMTIGKDLQTSTTLYSNSKLTGVRVTSADPTRLLVSLAAGTPGQASVTIGQETTVYLQALGASGSVTLTASGAGLTTATTQVQLVQSAVVLTGSIPQTVSTLASPVALQATLAPALSTFGYTGQSLRPGAAPVTVPINLSDPRLASVTPAQLVFNPGDIAKTFTLQPLAAGSLLLSLGVPPGFADPLSARQALIGITASQFTITGTPSIGKDLQSSLAAVLSPSPSQAVAVNLTVADPASLELGQVNSSVLSPALRLTLSGATTFNIAGLASSGTTTLQASASGLPASSFTITLQPTGFHFSAGAGSASAGTSATVQLGPAALDPGTLQPLADYPIRTDLQLPIAVTLTSSDPSIASVPQLVYFYGGDSRRTVTITARQPGVVTITATPAAGYATPASGNKLTFTVR